jgi:phosphonoacetaldehyde hydrolase
MSERFRHLRAVVFDWAGTMVDVGSRAPMGAFVEVFAAFGVTITVADARQPMGLPKLDHIRALGRLPRVAAAWRATHGRDFGEADAQAVYARFVPLNREVVGNFAGLAPGAAALVTRLRARGLKIGSTTGYTRDIMERLLPLAAAQGYAPDNLVCAGDLAAGRPTPLMMYQCFVDLAVWPAHAVVKVDDTAPGIAEAVAAGSWAIGVTLTGNGVGLSADELAALDDAARAAHRERVGAELRAAGAWATIDGVAELEPVLERIDAALGAGVRPARPADAAP